MNRNKYRQLLILLISGAFTLPLLAQFHTPVLTGVEDQALLDQLVNQYKPNNIFGYGQARDTLFSQVYMENDSLSCVYSGHTVYLDPNQDPTVAAFQGGSDNGINTEHTYPRSLGAESGNAKSDMHHLYPTKTPVNAERGNLPFGEVPDDQTIEWYYLTNEQSSIPSQNIDAYSEKGASAFEPREDHKGNVARAMFYFYTMYKSQADAANSSFFENQKETLCDWHLLDPVDQKEWERNAKIATYQEGKANPFILDSTVATRSYCGELISSITSTGQIANGFDLYQNTPNPVYTSTTISYRLEQSFQVRLTLFDATGRLCKILVDEEQGIGMHELKVEEAILGKGMLYIYQLELFDGTNYHISARKLLKAGRR